MTSTDKQSNILLCEWDTPFQTPPFKQIHDEDYIPALEAAIHEAERGIASIASQESAPTFENTIEALEKNDEKIDRISNLLFNLNECNTNEEMQQVVMTATTELTRYSNNVFMDESLYKRVQYLYDRRNEMSFNSEQLQVLDNYHLSFVRHGAGLDEESKKKFADNAERLAILSEKFNQNALADTNNYLLHITDEKELSGLPQNNIEAAAAEAASRKMEGWVFTLAFPSYGPFMRHADSRSLREELWRAYNSRGNRGTDNDNNEIIREIVNLRLCQARLTGHPDYADYRLSNTMAQTTATVKRFLEGLLEASYPIAVREVAELEEYAHNLGAELPLQQWDFAYYSEKLRKERYDFDSELLRSYFPIEKVRQGIFGLYNSLYGLTFNENSDVEVYHPDVKVYEVHDGERLMGLLYMDMHPRANKRSGAWMTDFRGQSNMSGREVRPLIQIVCNFTKPVGEKPSLLSFDEVETFMHEFGHAMHGMLSDVHYPSVSGTSVRHDFVEMPSQVMENWCYETSFLNTFARHYQSGEPIPEEYIMKIRRCQQYHAGYLCLRQLNLGMTDMAFHTITEPLHEGTRADIFEHTIMKELLPVNESTCTSTSFTHIFCGGYAAGYYGYKWAEVLDADIFSKFKANGIFDKATATAFRREILSKGGSEHPAVLFRNFMGREPDNKAFMQRCGFTV